MRTRLSSAGSSATRRPVLVSCSEIVGKVRQPYRGAGRPPGVVGRVRAVSGQVTHAHRMSLVDDAFRSLPDRYLGAAPGFDATYHIRFGDLGRSWEFPCTAHAALVLKGSTRLEPDVTLQTDSD